MQRRSVQCVCLPRIYIWNNEPERAKDAMWAAISSCGAPFYDERSRKVEKVLQVNFEMYQVYIISIYLSI